MKVFQSEIMSLKCVDADLGKACADTCQVKIDECLEFCDDPNCNSRCQGQWLDCLAACPCYSGFFPFPALFNPSKDVLMAAKTAQIQFAKALWSIFSSLMSVWRSSTKECTGTPTREKSSSEISTTNSTRDLTLVRVILFLDFGRFFFRGFLLRNDEWRALASWWLVQSRVRRRKQP